MTQAYQTTQNDKSLPHKLLLALRIIQHNENIKSLCFICYCRCQNNWKVKSKQGIPLKKRLFKSPIWDDFQFSIITMFSVKENSH